MQQPFAFIRKERPLGGKFQQFCPTVWVCGFGREFPAGLSVFQVFSEPPHRAD
jgi:hypothetical protein